VEEPSAAFRPEARGRAVGIWSGIARLSDFLYLSFVFIDILALFPRICSREVEESRRSGGLRHFPACGPRATVAVGSGSPTPRLFDPSTSRLYLEAETTGRDYG
jgi:hypothetical protein